MNQLGIDMIAAYSPEARGRSERMFRTLQGRLPKELKLAGISTIEDANEFLKNDFLPRFNKKFQFKALEEGSAFIPWSSQQHLNLNDILSLQEERTVKKDNTVSYKGKIFQIPKDNNRYSYAKTVVRMHEYIDGSIAIFYGPRKLIVFDANEVFKTEDKKVNVFNGDRLLNLPTGSTGLYENKSGRLRRQLVSSPRIEFLRNAPQYLKILQSNHLVANCLHQLLKPTVKTSDMKPHQMHMLRPSLCR
jgi:hypothetical protein